MIDLKVDVNVNVGLLLTPNIDLSLKILAMNVLEVEEKLKELSEENPLIKIDDDIGVHKKPINEDKKFKELEDSYKERFYSDENVDLLEVMVADSETLAQSLIKQVSFEYDLEEIDYEIAKFIVFNLDDKGFLDVDLNVIEEKFKKDIKRIDSIRRMIMELEPIGCGCLNTVEFLKFQIDVYESEHSKLLSDLIDVMYLTTNPSIKRIKEKMKIDDNMLKNLFDELSNFYFYPLENYAVLDNTIYIEPDVYIKKVGEKYIAVLNEKNLSRVNIDKNLFGEYAEDPEAKGFVEEKYRQAKQFLLAIAQRNKTLLKTVELIIERQKSFFENGIIMPLTRKDIAEKLGYNVSTITRAVSNKYVEFDGKIIPLKEFFSFGVGKNISKDFVKNTIKNLIEQEDKNNPLNDDEIKNILEKDGINITRRTVTKYRKEMNIANSRQRKCQII